METGGRGGSAGAAEAAGRLAGRGPPGPGGERRGRVGAERAPRRGPGTVVDLADRLPRRRADALVQRGRRARQPRGVDVVAVERGLRGEPRERFGDDELVADVPGEREAVAEPAPRRLAAAPREVQPRV